MARMHSNVTGESAPLVSVVMAVYNGERYLAEAIDSILTQTFNNFEFIIIDDGSQDGSVDIIRDYAQEDGRIRLLQHQENRGQADACNTGIADSRGSLIAMMDCDDISLPERLEKQVAFLENNPEIGALGTCGHVMNRDMSALHTEFVVPPQHALIALQHFLWYGVLGASVVYRRDYLIAVDGFEPGRRYVNDLELMSRLLDQTPIQLANLSDFLYLYRKHDQLKFRDQNSGPHIEGKRLRRLDLARMGFIESEAAWDRLVRFRPWRKLGWVERRALKRDLKRLIDAMIAANWVEPVDKPLMIAEINRRLELASPRRWQQFMHWRRHRLGF